MIRNGCLKLCFLLLVLTAFTATSFAQVRLVHNPVFFAKENQPIALSVRVEGGASMSDEMRVYYRLQGTDNYTYVILDNFGDEFRGQLPAQNISAVKVEYFLSLIKGGNIYTLPQNNPYYEPFEIQLTPGDAIQEEAPPPPPLSELPQQTGALLPLDETKYLIISPEDGQVVAMEDIVIAVSLFFNPGEIDVYKTRLLIDGRQIKPELSEDLITFVPPRINEGWREIDLYFSTVDGKQYQPVRWRFNATSAARVSARKTPLIAGASGRIYAESRSEKYSGTKLENNLIGGHLSGKKGGLSYGTRFYVTSLEDKNFQPRNRFLFWLDAKILKLYAGDTQPRFSELMLSGKRVRGVNAQLNLRIINFDFVMGETYRSVEGIYDNNAIQRYGTFKQNLLGLKTSFGNPNGTHWGISALKVKDDMNSIQYGFKPKDNVVAGSEFELSMFRNRFRWRSEVAFSLLTDDISGGSITKEDLDDLVGDIPIDPADYEKYLILNASTIPLDPRKGSSVAYTSTLQMNMLNNQLTVKYKSIGAKYNSLGNPFIRKNIRGLFVNDRIRLWRNRVYLNLGYEKYKDNFSQDDGKPILDLETLRYGFNFFPGAGLPNLNVNYRSYKRNNGVLSFDPNAATPIDSREDNTQNELTFNMNYDFILFNLNNNFSVNYITLDKKDAYSNNRLPMPQFFPLGINNDIQSFALQSKFQIPLTTTISYANNENSFIGGLNLFKFNSLDLRGDYRMLQNRLNLYAGFRRFSASGGTDLNQPGANLLGNTVIKYSKAQFDVGGRLTVKQRHVFIVDLTSINFQDDGGFTNSAGQFVSNQSFKDYSVRFRYELQF